jgi:hypothetical protein
VTSLTLLIIGIPAALFRFARRRHEAQLEEQPAVEYVENWTFPPKWREHTTTKEKRSA